MAEPIPYKVQSGENMMDIAKKLGLKDWHQLKEYHDSVSDQKTTEMPFAGSTIMVPPRKEIYEINGEEPPLDPVEEEKEAGQKQEEEKKKEEEEKKQEELSKGEHDGKYFVVHGAKCVCDKAVNPMQTADLQVTSHKSIVLNDQSKKYLATEEDKTFIPPAATFGQCKLQPTTGGYLPCSLSPAPKWTKTYESTQVLGKKTLTEISELQCMIGGKITVKKHGQSDSVSNAHAENTDPLELAAVNPAVEMPKKKEEYPVVTSITITEIENREDFKEKDSKDKAIIYLRKNEEASFKANLKSGNKQLTSWMVYSDHQGSKEERLLVKEQIGTEFSQGFGDLGIFRIEGYGKPKTHEYEKGKYDKCDPSCSIDLEVIENKLSDLEVNSNEFSSRIDPSKTLKFRKGVPSVIKAKFSIPRLTADEKARLTMSLLDGDGNTLTDFITTASSLTFIPKNSKAIYTVIAQFTTEAGEVIEKKLTGESEGNVVLAISHGSEVVRPGTVMNFQVSKMRYSFDTKPSDYSLTSEERSEIKWNLDGVLVGTGNSLTIPGNKLTTPGKHVVEAYSKTANATGKGAKKEDDDWHFEVKENDVVSFKLSGNPKVGKPITAIVDKMVFADLQANEVIQWIAPLIKRTGKSVTVIPKVAGNFSVTCKINNQKGTTQEINVLEAKIVDGFWHDLQGNEISRATWGQKVLYSIGGENLKGENIKANVIDKDKVSGDDFAADKNFAFGDAAYTNFALQLDQKVQDNTTSSLTPDASLFVKAQIQDIDKIQKEVPAKKGAQKYLNVSSSHNVYRALIGDSNGNQRHNPVDYDMKSFVYANTTYPKGSKLTVKIFEDKNWAIDPEAKELVNSGVVKEDGTLVTTVDWGKLKDAKQNKKTKTYYAKIFDEKDNELFDGSESNTLCNAILIPQSILKKQVGYTSAVLVGSEDVPNIETGKCVCEEQYKELIWGGKVSCDFRQKVVEICGELWGESRKMDMANGLMTVMNVETAGSFKAHQIMGKTLGNVNSIKKDDFWLIKKDENGKEISRGSRAVGLIQFTQSALQAIGEFTAGTGFEKLHEVKLTFAKMGEINQLDKVKKYFENSKNTIKSPEDIYLAVFAPKGVAKADDYVLYEKGTVEYEQNASVDTKSTGINKDDGKIQRSEILERYHDSEKKGGGNKAKEFNCIAAKKKQDKQDTGKWHDPLDICQRTKYNFSGGQNIEGGSFGKVRNSETKNHQGIDLFTIPGNTVYACVDGTVVEQRLSTSGGNLITIKIKNKKDLIDRKTEINYQIQFDSKGDKGEQINAANFSLENDTNLYLRYYHLSKVDIKNGDDVNSGQIIGKSGVTGNATGTMGPHLHFEILNTTAYPKGLSNRMNPAFFIKLKAINDNEQDRDCKFKYYKDGTKK